MVPCLWQELIDVCHINGINTDSGKIALHTGLRGQSLDPALKFTSYVTCVEPLLISGPQDPHLYHGTAVFVLAALLG